MKTEELSIALLERLKLAGKTLSTAESCTGGGIGHVLTAVPGSSAVYYGGVISYTNVVKAAVLGVPEEILLEKGAVSPETAVAMAEGVRSKLATDYAVSVTGIAGPDGDGSGKPVGLVYIGVAGPDKSEAVEYLFSGGRTAVREQAVQAALLQLMRVIK